MRLKLTETMDRIPDDTCYAECEGCGAILGPYTVYWVTDGGDSFCTEGCAFRHLRASKADRKSVEKE